jgi:hypothetical protein
VIHQLLGAIGKQLFRVFVQGAIMGICIAGAIFGGMILGMEAGYIVLIIESAAITALLALIAAKTFENMESLE